MNISKLLYISGIQCEKLLWLKKNNREALTSPDSSTKERFEVGNMVGDLACQLFPNGKKIPYEGTTFDEKISLTQSWLNEGIKSIYEASFSYNGIFVMIDILHKNDNGDFEIYEVKSSTSIKDVYQDDAAIQHYVLNGLGYKINSTNIIHIDKSYTLKNKIDVNKLFKIVDITNEVIALQNKTSRYLLKFESMLSRHSEPTTDIGEHCFKPYECSGIDYCWKKQKGISSSSVFSIGGIHKKKAFKLLDKGITSIMDIDDFSDFTPQQKIQIESEQKNLEHINIDAIKDFVKKLTYPICYLDFEFYRQTIPKFENTGPSTQITFQYSAHIQHKDGRLEHKSFLGEAGSDPRQKLAEKLVQDIPNNITVLAYHMSVEKGVIKKLADLYPEFSDHLMSIHNNIIDLMIPFKNKDYYSPKMRGKYSIKNVLPALVPEMEDAYENLVGVHNGGEAMSAFHKIKKSTDIQEVEKIRSQLLDYCKLDTLAMVEILKKLTLYTTNAKKT